MRATFQPSQPRFPQITRPLQAIYWTELVPLARRQRTGSAIHAPLGHAHISHSSIDFRFDREELMELGS